MKNKEMNRRSPVTKGGRNDRVKKSPFETTV